MQNELFETSFLEKFLPFRAYCGVGRATLSTFFRQVIVITGQLFQDHVLHTIRKLVPRKFGICSELGGCKFLAIGPWS